MKGVILAAGISSRLMPLTESVPKCLLEVGGKTILGRALENLVSHGITRIVIVTGYRENQIRGFIRDAFPALDVEFVTNERFETTNNSYSLWLTERAAGDGDILLLDSDIVFDRRIIGVLRESGHATCLAMKSGHSLGEEEIKVQVGPRGAVQRIGKDVPPREAAGESIGIELLGREFLRPLYRILERMMTVQRSVNLWYESAFQETIDAGVSMTAVDVGGLDCIEIDTAGDLQAARSVGFSGGRREG